MVGITSCESVLDEKVESEFSDDLLKTKDGVQSVLANAYGSVPTIRNIVKRSDMTSDILWQSGGGEQGTATPLINFNWDSSNTLEAMDWGNFWNAIRDANICLKFAPDASGFADEKSRTQFIAEARFVRLWAYYFLYDQYGPMPIRESMDSPMNLARASEEEFLAFMDKEFEDIMKDIYLVGEEPNYGRVNIGGVMGLAVNWYLNRKNWEKANKYADEIIKLNKYSLFPDYNQLFALENEHNCEFMLVYCCLANIKANDLLSTCWPTDVYTVLDACIPGTTNTQWDSYASNYRMYRSFYDSFAENDQRKGRILTKYINKNGVTIDLLEDNAANSIGNARGLKFPPDPAATGNGCGNDFPVIRYAEILLSKAEALNELHGPNEESIELVNKIRRRAGLDDISLSDYSDKDKLRQHIIDERKWEFWYEGKRRDDLIRTGQYISKAIERGVNAKDTHVRFPIPQSAIDSNPNLEQNPGY